MSSHPSVSDEKLASSHTRPSAFSRLFRRTASSPASDSDHAPPTISKWSMGVLNDPQTVEVPGSVLLLASNRNEPLGMHNIKSRNSHSSIPTGFPVDLPNCPATPRSRPITPAGNHPAPPPPTSPPPPPREDKKTTQDGQIILDPQPEDSANDPLNWPTWRRDTALLSLGFYCMLGGGTTPIIAAGFTDVAHEYDVEVETVALTTGLFMMGLGVGSVFVSPTAILYGKRPVYLTSAILFIATSLWAGWSPSFASLVTARVFQGIAVSPVECLPSATIAEIFFLHERAFRIGIYTLLLLGGKNLVPLVSAAIIGRFGWRWVFWIMAMIVALGGILLFLFVPETFWDRTPTRKSSKRPGFLRRLSSRFSAHKTPVPEPVPQPLPLQRSPSPGAGQRQHNLHVGFVEASVLEGQRDNHDTPNDTSMDISPAPPPNAETKPVGTSSGVDYSAHINISEKESVSSAGHPVVPKFQQYTQNLRQQPAKSFVQQLKPFHGRLHGDRWAKVLVRPLILFAYPAVLWSSVVYACSIGWLIVISETMAIIYRNPETYNFTALQTGLVYISPFVGGILGTGVAGKLSDVVVKTMARRNGGLYEPEFRLVMTIPILITTCVGLMGFGWSAQKNDHWMVPTILFGVVSFGCSLGSTTAITFCVDSYRQYAGEALVTLNFCKNILHGMVFSLFVGHWLADDGPKMVFIWIGIIQLILLLFTIPLFIYGKRLRMWTVRRNLMEKF